MTDAITLGFLAGYGSLADGTLRLKVDVPKEFARDALAVLADAIGQQVSVARLEMPDGGQAPGAAARLVNSASDQGQAADQPNNCREPAGAGLPCAAAGTPPRRWDDIPLPQQAGILRKEPAYRDFLGIETVEEAAIEQHEICGVDSCAELATDPNAAAIWRAHCEAYQAWSGRMAEQRG